MLMIEIEIMIISSHYVNDLNINFYYYNVLHIFILKLPVYILNNLPNFKIVNVAIHLKSVKFFMQFDSSS